MQEVRKLVFLGDIMLGRGVETAYRRHGIDFLLSGITPERFAHNIVVGNLEAPFSAQAAYYKGKAEKLSFSTPEDLAVILNGLNVNCVSLANNHMTDCGVHGVKKTQRVLEQSGIVSCGAGTNQDEAFRVVEISDSPLKIGLMSVCAFNQFVKFAGQYSWGIAPFNPDIIREVMKSCYLYDLIILSIHWGIDYYPFPIPVYVGLVKKLIDDIPNLRIVVGHHPHLIQPIIRYKDSLIACSLGNFVFDEPFVLSRRGMILTVSISRDMALDYHVQLSSLDDDNRLCYLSPDETSIELDRIDGIRQKMNNDDEAYKRMDDLIVVKDIAHIIQDFSFEKIKLLFSLYGTEVIIKCLIRRTMRVLKRRMN